MAINITEENFDQVVLKSETPVLLDFWAEWCGPCRMISPIIDELHQEFEGKAVIGKVNVDDNSEVPSQYGVRNIPTLLVFKGGEVVDKLVGAVPKSQILEKLEEYMKYISLLSERIATHIIFRIFRIFCKIFSGRIYYRKT